jgi:predicted nucleotidyltransferase
MTDYLTARYDFVEDSGDWLLRRRHIGKPTAYVKARFAMTEAGIEDMKALRTALNKAIREAEQLLLK